MYMKSVEHLLVALGELAGHVVETRRSVSVCYIILKEAKNTLNAVQASNWCSCCRDVMRLQIGGEIGP